MATRGKANKQGEGGGAGERSALNPLEKKPQDRTPYEKIEMATKRIMPEGQQQQDKQKPWHTPTKNGSAKE
ncbi:hypothetical protein NSK_002904 [Nannochloropsis salina CCMP1776]|jgi:hypothetical protein|uniref:Uncharacterized protein n=1 Tax=Nannochloropsis salina CCMP1776 TaxID=1027361 RepID=A0A4D9D4Z9_9STRA|nr:hypothetical protein NSK_002904 [Nannochloropsis salina CCMP1776]|eukprot:TFJ86084.1 hypothetical protein NSK_002904 [Nannochloropsis salina CCMP1776]